MKKATLLLLVVIGLFACKDKKLSNYSYSAESVIEMKTTACYGKCPVFTMTIDGMGNATYHGKRYAKKQGAHKKQFNAQETNALFKAFENAEYFNFEDEYTSDVTDLSTTYLTFRHRGKDKKIKLYFDYPTKLKELSALTRTYADSEGWMKAN